MKLILETRWISLLDTEINLAAALAGITTDQQTTSLRSISEVYRRRPQPAGPFGWVHSLLQAQPMRLGVRAMRDSAA
ncbi:MAG: hypothetical protein ACKOKG_09050 [Verrucomicrobiota bacterium]